MTKFTLAVLTAASLTSISILPAIAQTYCPNQRCPEASEPDNCGSQLGHLRRVYPEEVAGIDDDYRVWITELCPDTALMRSDGNATYLRPTIAANDVLAEALERRGYSADDVFAVRMMGDDTISLYVHRFER